MAPLWLSYSYTVRSGGGITAYNCTHEDSEVEEFSLLPMEPCPDFRMAYLREENYIPIQLLQKKEFNTIHGFGAKIVRTLFIFRCDGEPVTYAYHQRVLQLDQTTVMNIYKLKLWRDDIMTRVDASPIAVTLNGTTHKSRNLKGWTSGNGECGGEDFALHSVNYEDAVLEATYEILLYDGSMTVNLENDLVRTFAGATCTYSDGYCTDYVYGDIYWNKNEHDPEVCDQHTYLVLYDGKGMVNTYKETSLTKQTRVITVTEDSAAFSLIQTEKVMLCNILGYRTEHPKLFIVELKHHLRFFKKQQAHSLDLDLNAFRDSKFIHLERHMGSSIRDLNANVMNKLCRIQAQLISNLQSIAYTDAMSFAYSWMKKPGYNALVRGEVIHLISCTPVQVKVHAVAYCTHELPVVYLNESMYMHPRSHILSRHAEPVPCTPLYSVKYRLQGVWYVLSPNLVRTQPPAILKTHLNFTNWQYKQLKIGTVGIYSMADLNRQRSSVLFPIERRTITRQIADTAAGLQTGPRSFDMLSLIDQDHFKSIMVSYWEELDTSIRVFGQYSGFVLGIGFIYKIGTAICAGTLNGSAVTQMFGKCCGLLACFLPGIAHLALLYGKEEQHRTGNTRISPKGAWEIYRNQKTSRHRQPSEENYNKEQKLELEEPEGIMV